MRFQIERRPMCSVNSMTRQGVGVAHGVSCATCLFGAEMGDVVDETAVYLASERYDDFEVSNLWLSPRLFANLLRQIPMKEKSAIRLLLNYFEAPFLLSSCHTPQSCKPIGQLEALSHPCEYPKPSRRPQGLVVRIHSPSVLLDEVYLVIAPCNHWPPWGITIHLGHCKL